MASAVCQYGWGLTGTMLRLFLLFIIYYFPVGKFGDEMMMTYARRDMRQSVFFGGFLPGDNDLILGPVVQGKDSTIKKFFAPGLWTLLLLGSSLDP